MTCAQERARAQGESWNGHPTEAVPAAANRTTVGKVHVAAPDAAEAVVEKAAVQGGEFRVLVTGSRTWSDARAVYVELEQLLAEHGGGHGDGGSGGGLVIVHGACPGGVDRIVAGWAGRHGVRTETHPAAWQSDGRAAGPRRNRAMVQAGAALCLAWIRDQSPGASQTARLAEQAGIPTRRIAS